MQKRWIYILLIAFSITFGVLLPINYCFGQAYQFTQFYAAPTFLNPAFVGTGTCMRLSSDYRVQWPSIPGGFKTYLLSFDHDLDGKHNGLGFLLTNDKAGSGNLRSTGINGQYSYQLMLSREWMLSTGFEAGYNTRNYDFHKFVFADQLANGTSSTVEQPLSNRIHYLDLSSGILLYSERSWFGFSARHLNTPNQAMVSEESRLPVLYSFHGGWVIPLTSKGEAGKMFAKHNITPAFNYRSEKKFDQFDIGFYYSYTQFTAGIWYRGIPLFKAYKTGYPNNDALAFVIGTSVDRFKFGYSYDVTISWLAGHTAGSHEVSVSYQFCDPSKKRKKLVIPCPKF